MDKISLSLCLDYSNLTIITTRRTAYLLQAFRELYYRQTGGMGRPLTPQHRLRVSVLL